MRNQGFAPRIQSKVGRYNPQKNKPATFRSSQSRTQPEQQGETSWEKSSRWYNKLVGNKGHYFHEHVILPRALTLLDLKPADSILDLGCGQGIFSRQIPKGIPYHGIDNSTSLIELARKQDRNPTHTFEIKDASRPFHLPQSFSHVSCILALQNIAKPNIVIENAGINLLKNGKFLIVLNHPCFRIPRQSGWTIEPNNNLQQRWINRYRSEMTIPIIMHPGKSKSEATISYHHSLADYSLFLKEAGFVIEQIEEWYSDKKSEGRQAKRENRSRSEIPLFMAIMARKV